LKPQVTADRGQGDADHRRIHHDHGQRPRHGHQDEHATSSGKRCCRKRFGHGFGHGFDHDATRWDDQPVPRGGMEDPPERERLTRMTTGHRGGWALFSPGRVDRRPSVRVRFSHADSPHHRHAASPRGLDPHRNVRDGAPTQRRFSSSGVAAKRLNAMSSESTPSPARKPCSPTSRPMR
jgi:hypothetical protein